VPSDYLKSTMVVFDIVYRPKMTKLLQKAKTKGCRIITGDKMLLYQAVKQFELFTGEKAPIEVMRKSLIIS
jgi:shikimate dehydrogenase